MFNEYQYILDEDKNIKPIKTWENGELIMENLKIWSEAFHDTEKRRVGYDKINNVVVSTVFLGIDHRFPPFNGPPILFETALLEDDDFEIVERYATYDGALAGHKRHVGEIKSGE